MVLVINVFSWMKQLNGDLLSQVSYPNQIDATRSKPQLVRAILQGSLRDHLAQNGIDAHCDSFGRHNSNNSIPAIDLNAITCSRIIPGLALYVSISFMPLYLA